MRDGDARGLQIRGKVDMAKLFHIVIPWGRRAKATPHACEMSRDGQKGLRERTRAGTVLLVPKKLPKNNHHTVYLI